MPIKIVRQDITKMDCDAIVNPTDSYYSHKGGVDEAIHNAAGKELYTECINKGFLSCSNAIITNSFLLPCKYIIHTMGPKWVDGNENEESRLISCYNEVLKLAKENKCESIAIPLISSGTFGFPKDKVLKIAISEISSFLLDNEMLVYIVVYDKTSYSISEKLFCDVESYIENEYSGYILGARRRKTPYDKCYSQVAESYSEYDTCCKSDRSLDDFFRNMDKGFAETLFDYIDKKGMTDVECYKKANVDKKTFSKIKCNMDYRPSKVTAVSFAIALRLDLEETNHLLNTVGMSLSKSSKFDVIIEYFITTGNYKDIFDVNETLYQFDQVGLGV